MIKNPNCPVDARAAGEGNLEILVQSGSGQSLPTEVEAIGDNEAIFGVSFTPLETIVEESQSQLSSLNSLSQHSTQWVTFEFGPVSDKDNHCLRCYLMALPR